MFDFITDRLQGALGGWAGGARFGFLAGFVIFGLISLAMSFSSGALMADGGASLITAAGAGVVGGAFGAFATSIAGMGKGLLFGTGKEEEQAAQAEQQAQAQGRGQQIVQEQGAPSAPGPTPVVAPRNQGQNQGRG